MKTGVYKHWTQSEMIQLKNIVDKALTAQSGYNLAAKEFGVSEKSCHMAYRRYKNKLAQLNKQTVVDRKPITQQVIKQETKSSNTLEINIKGINLDLNKGKIIINY
jgi:hypothetical protein